MATVLSSKVAVTVPPIVTSSLPTMPLKLAEVKVAASLPSYCLLLAETLTVNSLADRVTSAEVLLLLSQPVALSTVAA